MARKKRIRTISVIVPESPFVGPDLRSRRPCLAALDVDKLMEWWPGTPHTPHRDPEKVQAIQRALDWKRVAQIAAYLLQREIINTPQRLDKYFRRIYEPTALEPGRERAPRGAPSPRLHAEGQGKAPATAGMDYGVPAPQRTGALALGCLTVESVMHERDVCSLPSPLVGEGAERTK